MTTETVTDKKTKTTEKIFEPKKFKVVICNDDVTPIDFVINLLITVFKHNQPSAHELTLSVHRSGSAIAGIYRFEIAEQKAIDATSLARSNGFPLLIKVEPE